MKRYKLKSWVKWLIVGIVLFVLLAIVEKSDRDFVETCMEHGYSKYYCEAHK